MLTTSQQCNFSLEFSYIRSLTECVRDFQNDALWDTFLHDHQLLNQTILQCFVELRFINIDQLIFIKELGEGAFGRVYLGSCINLFTGK